MEETKVNNVEIENTNVENTNIDEEMKRSYIDYAMSVIIGRALPDVRDGLKPVHRRILFAMNDLRNDWNKPYKKSARIVGDVIGKYHPHGDSAVYDAAVRMAQDFSLRYPLVEGQGNFGSIDGDSPAAMRYTEVRLQKLSMEILQDIEKDTVNFVVNYDETLSEPVVLPTKLPLLLLNGSSGIAVGMTTNIPPHNITELINGINALIDNPDIEIDELMQHIPAPDFPTGGEIYGRRGVIEAYRNGKGIIKVRAKTSIEEEKESKKIIVTELPYQVNKAKLVEKIAELANDKIIQGIRFVRDESDRQGMRIVIGLKKDEFPEIIINQLFKHTYMQNSFGIIFLAIVDGQPKRLNLKEILENFVAHRKDVVTRRVKFELRNAKIKEHILEGLKVAIDNLDEVVALIRKSKSPAEAREGLIERFKLSNEQVQAILDMRLQKLTGLEREKIVEDYEKIVKAITRYEEILGDEQEVLDIIKQECAEINEEFGDERRTKIVDAQAEINIEDIIQEEDMVISITKSGYIKRTPLSLYESQKRGGKGKKAMGTKDEDFVEKLFIASTHATFLFFTNRGKVYWSKVYEIPEVGRTSMGKAIVNFFNFEEGEVLTTTLAVKDFEENQNILMATKKGIIKKSKLVDYSNPRSNGVIAIRLSEGDELVSAGISKSEDDHIFVSSNFGKSIRFKESDIRLIGRVGKGVIAMKMKKEDFVVNMEILDQTDNKEKFLFTATENGFGKRTAIENYRVQARSGKGVISINTSKRNGLVIGATIVDEDDELVLITNSGILIRIETSGVSVVGRNTQGVKLINIEKDEKVVSIVRLPKHEE